jgi:hypothetical protein
VTLARFKDLCIDANDTDLLGTFWASVLQRQWEPDFGGRGNGAITGPTSQHTIWVNDVPEVHTVKHRVHFDIYCRSLAELEELGATVLEPQHDDWTWTLMADPEGGEFCAFLRDVLPGERMHGLVVDCADQEATAAWWAEVYGAELIRQPEGYSTLKSIEGMPILTMDFDNVPEARTVKNRVHWDITVPHADEVGALVEAGASLVRPPDDEIGWTVMADPEGNEFCVFVTPDIS